LKVEKKGKGLFEVLTITRKKIRTIKRKKVGTDEFALPLP